MNGAEHQLATSDLRGSKVVMTDHLFFEVNQAYRYNHGKTKWSTNYYAHPVEQYGGWRDPGPIPEITGINRLSTDGSVEWRKAVEMDLGNFDTPAPLSTYRYGYVGGGGRTYYY